MLFQRHERGIHAVSATGEVGTGPHHWSYTLTGATGANRRAGRAVPNRRGAVTGARPGTGENSASQTPNLRPAAPVRIRPARSDAQPRDSRRRARSFSKSRALPGVAGMRPRRRPRSATAARTGGSASTRRPNASDAGLISYRRSSSRAAATASRSASLNCRCAGRRPRSARRPRSGRAPRSARPPRRHRAPRPRRAGPLPDRTATAAGREPGAGGRDPRDSGACEPTCRAA